MSAAININQALYQEDIQVEKKKEDALSTFDTFIKENVTDITMAERMYILKYKTSCILLGSMYIPRAKKKNSNSKYLFTIFKLLSAYLQNSNTRLVVSKITSSKIFFTIPKHSFEEIERLKRLLLSEIIAVNSLDLVNENGLSIMVNPIDKTLKIKLVDKWGYSELAFDNFSIKDVWKGNEIENAGEWTGKALPGTISKVDYRFLVGLHFVAPGEDNKSILAYRYQKMAKNIDRFIKYDIKHGINWDDLLYKSSYNMVSQH